MKKILLAHVLLMMLFTSQTKDIVLENPSFEGKPHIGDWLDIEERRDTVTNGWIDCGFVDETAPDVHPSPEEEGAFFDVNNEPKDGNTYIGMVARDNGTYEAIGQKLSSNLEKGNVYEFSLYLARSKDYLSISRLTDRVIKYTTPIQLQIWGGNDICERGQLLGQSDRILNVDWEKCVMEFKPNEDWSWLIFEANFYVHPPLLYYTAANGNILIDHCSSIKKMIL